MGSFIAKELANQGEEVIVVDMENDSIDQNNITFFNVDITRYDDLLKVMKGVDFVHHNAALVPLRKAGKRFYEVNVQGTRNVLSAAKASRVKHLCHMSSSAVFGNVTEKDCPIKDNPSNLTPIESYGRSKADAEKIIISEMEKKDGLSCSIIRPRTILGKERLGIFQILFEWISEGQNIYIIGDGSNLFQFAHITDIANVSILCAGKMKKGFFNIGTQDFGTLREGLEALCHHSGRKSKVKSIPVWIAVPLLYLLDKMHLSPLGPYHYLAYQKNYYFDLSTPKEELGWMPKYSNREMLIDAYDWYLENKDKLNSFQNKSTHKGVIRQKILRILKHLS